ncbi:MAG: DUF3795 domain-containing protein [Candidatus Shapirobacteria bacterium]
MMAVCGMNCGVCAAYLRPKNKCAGCRSELGQKVNHCFVCKIKLCEEKGNVNKFCFECPKYPCPRLKQLDKRYRSKYGMSMIENLKKISEIGLVRFWDSENKRWECPKCGNRICVHNKRCYFCEGK